MAKNPRRLFGNTPRWLVPPAAAAASFETRSAEQESLHRAIPVGSREALDSFVGSRTLLIARTNTPDQTLPLH